MTNPDDDIDLRPLLGAIARSWRRIHPDDLTANEVFSLLTVLMAIENRLDGDPGQQLDAASDRPKLRLILTAIDPEEAP